MEMPPEEEMQYAMAGTPEVDEKVALAKDNVVIPQRFADLLSL